MAEPARLFRTMLETSAIMDRPPVVAPDGKGNPDVCTICGREVRMMVYRGTGVCCELHDQVSKGQLTLAEVDAILAGVTREDGIK